MKGGTYDRGLGAIAEGGGGRRIASEEAEESRWESLSEFYVVLCHTHRSDSRTSQLQNSEGYISRVLPDLALVPLG